MMLYATVTTLQLVFEYSEIRFNKSTEKLTLVKEREIHNFTNDNGIKFAVGWKAYDDDRIDPNVGRIYLHQEILDYTENDLSINQDIVEEVPLEPCSISNFTKELLEDTEHI